MQAQWFLTSLSLPWKSVKGGLRWWWSTSFISILIPSSPLRWLLCLTLFSFPSGLSSLFCRLSKPWSLNDVVLIPLLLSTKVVIPGLPYIWLGIWEDGVPGLPLAGLTGEFVADFLSAAVTATCDLTCGLLWGTWTLGDPGGGAGWCLGVASGLDVGSWMSPGRLSQSESLSGSAVFFCWN